MAFPPITHQPNLRVCPHSSAFFPQRCFKTKPFHIHKSFVSEIVSIYITPPASCSFKMNIYSWRQSLNVLHNTRSTMSLRSFCVNGKEAKLCHELDNLENAISLSKVTNKTNTPSYYTSLFIYLRNEP